MILARQDGTEIISAADRVESNRIVACVCVSVCLGTSRSYLKVSLSQDDVWVLFQFEDHTQKKVKGDDSDRTESTITLTPFSFDQAYRSIDGESTDSSSNSIL